MWKKVLGLLFIIIVLVNLKTQALAESGTTNFTSYMKELKTRTKGNWDAPLKKDSYSVVVQFRIAKSGDITQSSIFQTSGDKFVDAVALDTIEKSKPYKPLPAEFKGKSIDVQFTFKYTFYSGGKTFSRIAVIPLEHKAFYKNLSRKNKKIYNQYLECINQYFKTNLPKESFFKRKTFEASFVIQENGTIKGLIITKSSGNHIYDELVKETIQKANLSNIPTALGVKEIKLKYTINSGINSNIGNYYFYSPYQYLLPLFY